MEGRLLVLGSPEQASKTLATIETWINNVIPQKTAVLIFTVVIISNLPFNISREWLYCYSSYQKKYS
jgi:hypothetical protein